MPNQQTLPQLEKPPQPPTPSNRILKKLVYTIPDMSQLLQPFPESETHEHIKPHQDIVIMMDPSDPHLHATYFLPPPPQKRQPYVPPRIRNPTEFSPSPSPPPPIILTKQISLLGNPTWKLKPTTNRIFNKNDPRQCNLRFIRKHLKRWPLLEAKPKKVLLNIFNIKMKLNHFHLKRIRNFLTSYTTTFKHIKLFSYVSYIVENLDEFQEVGWWNFNKRHVAVQKHHLANIKSHAHVNDLGAQANVLPALRNDKQVDYFTTRCAGGPPDEGKHPTLLQWIAFYYYVREFFANKFIRSLEAELNIQYNF